MNSLSNRKTLLYKYIMLYLQDDILLVITTWILNKFFFFYFVLKPILTYRLCIWSYIS